MAIRHSIVLIQITHVIHLAWVLAMYFNGNATGKSSKEHRLFNSRIEVFRNNVVDAQSVPPKPELASPYNNLPRICNAI